MRAAVLMAGLLALGVACGGSSSPSPSPSSPSPSPSASPALQPSGLPAIQMTGEGFVPGGVLPAENGCDGAGQSPTILWHDVPPATQALVVLAEDPDAKNFVHWVVYDIPGHAPGLTAGISDEPTLGNGAYQGVNSFGKIGYGAPCPPKGSTHHYEFFVYALDAQLGLASGKTADEVVAAMSSHVTARGMMTVAFGR
jgi:Raf kinase inhibitor-like YbhB/YbcL family protein